MEFATSTCETIASSTNCIYTQTAPFLLTTPSLTIVLSLLVALVAFTAIQNVFVKQ